MRNWYSVSRARGAGELESMDPVVGEQLLEQGMGGLYNVGKAASHPPALVVLSHAPPGVSS